MKKITTFFLSLLRSFSRWEWTAIFFLVLAAVSSGVWLGYRHWIDNTVPVAVAGGTYREGIVAETLADITPTINVLTKIGFTEIDDEGQIVAAAATSWDISEDKKEYTFHLASGVDKGIVKDSLETNKSLFPDIEFEVREDSSVIFRLKQPFAPFLATTAEPIFPYGPYRIADEQRGLIKLKPRAESIVGQAFLDEISLSIYLDGFNLTQALSNDEIDGVADISEVENPLLLDQLDSWELELPRKIYAFFNTERDMLSKSDIRNKLKNNETLDEPVELKMVTLASPKHEELAATLAERWEPLGVTVTVETRTATELSQEVVPTRDYDVLIYGLDFGADPDPYPFWHSSQIGEEGLNLSNFANIDADRLLEKARQTDDQAERADLYRQFEEIYNKETPAIELEQVTSEFGTDQDIKGVRSIGHALSAADRFKHVIEWYRRTERVAKDS